MSKMTPRSILTAVLAVAISVNLVAGQAAACGTACFPSLAFTPPTVASGSAPNVNLDSWWCTRSSEYAFMGFSYDITACPSYDEMLRHFKDQRKTYGARYVRQYSACDTTGHTDNMVKAAYNAGLGLFAMVWWGFDNNDAYKTRLAAWLKTINTNPLAPYVVRSFAVGSEPLYDGAITYTALGTLIDQTRANITSTDTIQVTTSEMAYGYVKRNGTALLAHEDHIEGHILPFFSKTATTGDQAWADVWADIDWFRDQTSRAKKIYLSQTGWPSTAEVWAPNSPTADPSLASEQAYYELLNSKCEVLKTFPLGGLGWFAHLYADNTLPGWGVVNSTTKTTPKISFGARTSC
ncbi:glycoside hydrolase [Auriculariales sp. MPI-PUGE-AT-0066]|nr:glycoside hydrolase [Auriculariales sp. MPI-PUGE-AT-0066]